MIDKKKGRVSSAVSSAKAAFKSGKLDQYRPLTVTGTDGVKATCPTSWGPAMRR